jgi:diguanylate cyclase (GGDEF)-like protein
MFSFTKEANKKIGPTARKEHQVNTIAMAAKGAQSNVAISLAEISARLRELLPFIPVRLGAANAEQGGQSTLLNAIDIILTEAEVLKATVGEQSDRIAYLEQLATTDELTKLANRRGFELELNRTLSRAERQEEEGVLVYVDLDNFKPVNDTHGHAAGDDVLRQVAKVLRENTREMDVVGRLGGDEFAILLTGTNREDGLARAETLNLILNQSSVLWNNERIEISASFGIQAFQGGDNAATLIASADQAMYTIKQLKVSGGVPEVPKRRSLTNGEPAALARAAG